MPEPAAQKYDAFPYEGNAFPMTHPDRLAAVAILYGLAPPAVATARVLDLGCASGENLIPMAVAAPQGSFLGVDFSAVQIAAAKDTAGQLALSNIKFQTADIRDFDSAAGKFDYIIAHGVYSWVPADVRDKLLAICRDHLAPNGVAVISHNVFPGWHQRTMVREMMVRHAELFADPREQAREARRFVDFIATHLVRPETPYAQGVREVQAALRSESDSYVFHEFIEPVNFPIAFADFAVHAAAHRLQPLGDSEFATNLPGNLAKEVVPALSTMVGTDYVRWEQYLDYLTGRLFRYTLLIDRDHQLAHAPVPANFNRLLLSSSACPVRPQATIPSRAPLDFADDGALKFQTSDPVLQLAMSFLGQQFPRRVAFADLADHIARRSGTGPFPGQAIAAAILPAIWSGMIEIHAFGPAISVRVTARPTASPFARFEARARLRATTMHHRIVDLKTFDRAALLLLDGTRDQAQLAAELRAALDRGAIDRRELTADPADPRPSAELIAEAIPPFLRWAARRALLVG